MKPLDAYGTISIMENPWHGLCLFGCCQDRASPHGAVVGCGSVWWLQGALLKAELPALSVPAQGLMEISVSLQTSANAPGGTLLPVSSGINPADQPIKA